MPDLRHLLRRLRLSAPALSRQEPVPAEVVHRRPILIALGWAWYAYLTADSDEGRHEARRHLILWEGMAGGPPITVQELVAAWQSSTGLSTALAEREASTGVPSYPPFPQTDDDGDISSRTVGSS